MSSVESQQNTTENVTNIHSFDDFTTNTYFVNHIRPHFTDDKRLSWQAMGFLSYALRRSSNWQFCREDLVNRSSDKHRVLKSIIKELKELGYLRIDVVRENGFYKKWITNIYESPDLNPFYTPQEPEVQNALLDSEESRSAKRTSAECTITKTTTTTDPNLKNNNNNGALPFQKPSKPRTPANSEMISGDYHTNHPNSDLDKKSEGESVVVSLFNRLNKLPRNAMTIPTLQSLAQSNDLKQIEAKIRGMEIKASRAPDSIKEPGAFLISALKNNWILPTDEDIKKSSGGETTEEYLARMKAQDEEESRRQKEREASDAKQIAEFGRVLSPKERIAMLLPTVTEAVNAV